MTQTCATPGELYQRWLAAWTEFKPHRMIGLWDDEFSSLIYQAEEASTPLTQFNEIKAYWDEIPKLIKEINEVSQVDLNIQEIGDVAAIFARVRISLIVFSQPSSLAGEMRISFVSRRRKDGWKFVHYHESRALDMALIMQSLTLDTQG